MATASKKGDEKDEEKILDKMQKKILKDLKQQLDGCSEEEKLRMLEKKCMEKMRDIVKLERTDSKMQENIDRTQESLDSVNQELSQVKDMRIKLEALCKQLQKKNKEIIDLYKQAAIEDKERRKEQQQVFAAKIQEVQAKIETHDQERRNQLVENDKLREQLSSFIKQYEEREKHFEVQIQAKEAERAKAEQKQLQAEEQCRAALREAQDFNAKTEEHIQKEQQLREEICSYTEKYKNFQETVGKSNEAFAEFKVDSEKTGRRIRNLEKEKRELQVRKEAGDAAVREAQEAVDALKREEAALMRQRERMQGLCSRLQAERAALRDVLGMGSEGGESASAPAGSIDVS